MPKKKLNVTQQYARKIVDSIVAENLFGQYTIAERMLHAYFPDRLAEVEAEVDELLAAEPPALGEGIMGEPAKNMRRKS